MATGDTQGNNPERSSTIVPYYLLDANVLGKLFSNVKCVIQETENLQRDGGNFIITEPIKFEFLKPSTEKTHISKRESLLSQYTDTFLPISDDVTQTALQISKIYGLLRIEASRISYVDILTAAFLRKYHSSLILLTMDIQDFPPALFDVIKVDSLEETTIRFVMMHLKFSEPRFLDYKARFGI